MTVVRLELDSYDMIRALLNIILHLVPILIELCVYSIFKTDLARLVRLVLSYHGIIQIYDTAIFILSLSSLTMCSQANGEGA